MRNTVVLALLFVAISGVPTLAWEQSPLVAGDANGDGMVDQADAQILANYWGFSDVDWAQGDFDGDGRISSRDASIMAANWGYKTPEAGASVVPEPTTLIIWSVLGALAILWRRRR